MMNNPHINKLNKLPGVDTILKYPDVSKLIEEHSHDVVVHAIREVLDHARQDILNGGAEPQRKNIVSDIFMAVQAITGRLFKPVINATGVVIHTNLGRAPFGKQAFSDVQDLITGYSNLEYNLTKACRGSRGDLVREIIRFLTKSEDAIVVNNNAAAIILTLNTLARQKDVIISRGELIEIGGSFRIPEIMKASGAIMIEVGTTNRTRVEDYERAIGPNTGVLFKAHKSNFSIKGFTEEASIKQLSALGKKHSLPLIYDIGSGLLRKPKGLPLQNEPDVRQAIEDGTDIVTFSCDKLLGGPQAGIIAGKKELVNRLSCAPMMRALRVGKLTLAFLNAALRYYLDDEILISTMPLFKMLERSISELERLARTLQKELESHHIDAITIESTGQCGGGTLPYLEIKSYAVMLKPGRERKKDKVKWAEEIFRKLHFLERPVIGVLRKGDIIFDVLSVFEEDIPCIARAIARVVKEVNDR